MDGGSEFKSDNKKKQLRTTKDMRIVDSHDLQTSEGAQCIEDHNK